MTSPNQRSEKKQAEDMAREMWHAPHYTRVGAGTLYEHWVRGPSDAERAEKQAKESR